MMNVTLCQKTKGNEREIDSQEHVAPIKEYMLHTLKNTYI